MNNKLTFQNIKVAWRNLMKYKTQNIIAVLCLAVGMVCFSVTFIITQRMWQYWMREGGDPRRAKVELFTQGDSLIFVEPEVIQRVGNSHLPSIDFIDIHQWDFGAHIKFIDLEGKEHTVYTWWEWISPERLNYLGLRSAITGKRIPVLKPGDKIMTKGMLERTFGPEVNPIGFSLVQLANTTGNTITDVVDTGDWMLTDDKLLVVTDQLKEIAPFNKSYVRHFEVILAKGKKDTDLQEDLQKVLPEYKVKVKTKFSRFEIQGTTITMFLGSSILLIGLFGFLKTQIQLFRLRQREMGLRQCMGAQRSQLFSLMMWEVVIVFIFVTLLTLALTALLADYSIPILRTEIDEVSINMPRTYATELWICLATFLVTAGIAALSVRKVITTPLSEVVGKSRRTSTRGRSLLIVLQMVVCQMLVFWVLCFFTMGDNPLKHIEKPANADAFRSCIVTGNDEWKPELFDAIPHLQNMAGSTHLLEVYFRQDLKEGDSPIDPRDVRENEDGSRYCVYEALLTDEHLFGLLDMEVLPTDTKEMNHTNCVIPIYAPTERAGELRQKFGLQQKGEPEYRTIEKGKQAEKIGYANWLPLASLIGNYIRSSISYFYICETAYFLEKSTIDFRVWEDFGEAYERRSVSHEIIFKAKPGQYKKAMQELTDLYQEEGKYTLAKVPVNNLYEVCFSEQRTLELVLQILVVMIVVGLLCIVLTLFSSVSLDTRGRQKEVAIRKAHGANAGQIMWLFGRQYVWQLIISSIISILICFVFLLAMLGIVHYAPGHEPSRFQLWGALFCCSIPAVIIAFITLLTVGYKIYKVSKRPPIPLQGE